MIEKNKRNYDMKKQLLMLIMASLTTAAYANEKWHNTYNEEGPLTQGTISAGIKGGIAPTFWFGREPLFTDTTLSMNGKPFKTLDNEKTKDVTPNFRGLFSLVPAWAGVDVSYALYNNFEIVGEFAWQHATGQSVSFNGKDLGLETINSITLSMDNTDSFGGYVGFRHYLGPWFDCIYPYWGLKIGALHHRDITGSIAIKMGSDTRKTDSAIFFPQDTVLSGGAAVGFDSYITDCLKFRFGLEVIASGTRKGNADFIAKANQYDIKSKIGNVGSQLSIPITFGFVYEF